MSIGTDMLGKGVCKLNGHDLLGARKILSSTRKYFEGTNVEEDVIGTCNDFIEYIDAILTGIPNVYQPN